MFKTFVIKQAHISNCEHLSNSIMLTLYNIKCIVLFV